MPLSPLFKLRDEVTPEIIELLSQTTIGSNGARYSHLDTPQRIYESDNPLFLSMERNEKVIGNITFCRREQDWYIRYFAFHGMVQGSEKKKKVDKGNSFLKKELGQFFDDAFAGSIDGKPVRSMYAYIDPKNERSKWMSETFGFQVIRQLATQSYSRVSPKKSDRLEVLHNWDEIQSIIKQHFSHHAYFFTIHAEKPPFYVLRNEFDEIIAITRVTKANWKIDRLPGRFGKILTKLLPYIPYLKQLIRPEKHTFLVPEIVWAKDTNPALIDELFSAILEKEKLNLLLWWIDAEDPLYLAVKTKIKWGLLHKSIGTTAIDVVERTADGKPLFENRPVFVTAWDMV
jgi:hypothetical protein